MNTQTQNTEAFTIASGIAIPARTIPNAGPRESKYPVDDLQPGQAFAVPVENEKQARQKQSQFAGLAKSRGIKLVTRFVADDASNPGFTGISAPFLAVWHDGVLTADEKAAKEAKAAKIAAAKAAKQGTAPAVAESNEAASTGETSAPAGDEEVLVL